MIRLGIQLLLFTLLLVTACRQAPVDCPPTPEDEMGPYYRPDAPLRSKVGDGYRLNGRVLASRGCRPLPGARVEFWLAGPDGRYGDAWRATVIADAEGRYRFSSIPPGLYPGRVPHIHIRVSAAGFAPLVTQHYPDPDRDEATFDLVLAAPP